MYILHLTWFGTGSSPVGSVSITYILPFCRPSSILASAFIFLDSSPCHGYIPPSSLLLAGRILGGPGFLASPSLTPSSPMLRFSFPGPSSVETEDRKRGLFRKRSVLVLVLVRPPRSLRVNRGPEQSYFLPCFGAGEAPGSTHCGVVSCSPARAPGGALLSLCVVLSLFPDNLAFSSSIVPCCCRTRS